MAIRAKKGLKNINPINDKQRSNNLLIILPNRKPGGSNELSVLWDAKGWACSAILLI
jgi:hypothetical protein